MQNEILGAHPFVASPNVVATHTSQHPENEIVQHETARPSIISTESEIEVAKVDSAPRSIMKDFQEKVMSAPNCFKNVLRRFISR